MIKNTFINNENILEHSQERSALDETLNTSPHGCYSNRSVPKRTKLDRNENVQNSGLSNCDQNNLNKIFNCIQSVDIKSNEKERKMEAELEKKFTKEEMEKKLKKTVKDENGESRRNQLLEQIT